MDEIGPETIKKALRSALVAKRQQQVSILAATCSLRAQKALLAEDCWQRARQVALYLPIRGEMNTAMLLAHAWREGKQVLLPRCCRDEKGRMELVPCQSMDDVTKGYFGILEPCDAREALDWDAPALAPDLMILPGVAFDYQGYRLGFGGGYYDRALARAALARTCLVGLAYDWQQLPSLPRQEWDKAVHALCTENGVVWI